MKTLKISAETHADLSKTCDDFGFKLMDFAELCIKYAIAEFKEKGVSLDPLSIKNNQKAREELVENSANISKLGIKRYCEWLSMLTADQQEVLKHCMRAHKEEAQKVSMQEEAKKRMSMYENDVDTVISP